MKRNGRELLQAKKAVVAQEINNSRKGPRDLISLLVQANSASDSSQRISDEDILARRLHP
jgi:cytochrome P450